MENIKISELPVATALTGTEAVPLVQGGVTSKTTTQDIANLSVSGPVMPTFTFVTTNGLNPGYYFENYQINLNVDGNSLIGYRKTGNLSVNSSYTSTITSFTSNVEILKDMTTAYSNLSTLSFPNLVGVSGQWDFAPSLVTDLAASIPNLQIVGNRFRVLGASSILNLNFTSLTHIGTDLSISSSNSAVVTSINFSNLVSVGGNISITSQSAITSFNFNSLATCFAAITISGLTSLTSISFPSLTTLNNNNVSTALIVSTCAALTSFTLPNIVRIYSSGSTCINFTSGTANLTTFSFGSGLKQVGGTLGNVVFTSCALNQASVDNILVRLAALDGTNGTTAFLSRTVTITGTSSTPSATGLAAKATLQGRGCTVTTN
jgi:hypothetical protein